MSENAIEMVRLRNNFYRDNYRRVTLVLLVSMVLNIAFAASTYYLYSRNNYVYFATNPDGTLLPMVPLNDPYLNSEQVRSFATKAAITAMSYDFLNFQESLQFAQPYFSAGGFSNYLRALESSGNLDAVRNGQLVVKAVVSGAPQIVQEGLISNRYAWRINVPMIVTYQGGGSHFEQPVTVNMLVGRVSTLQSVDGVAIGQFTISDRRQNS